MLWSVIFLCILWLCLIAIFEMARISGIIGVNPFTPWRRVTRTWYRAGYYYFRLMRIERLRAERELINEMEDGIRDLQEKLVYYAFKDPKAFLGRDE